MKCWTLIKFHFQEVAPLSVSENGSHDLIRRKKSFLKIFFGEKGENVTLIIYVFRFLFEKNICSEKKKKYFKRNWDEQLNMNPLRED